MRSVAVMNKHSHLRRRRRGLTVAGAVLFSCVLFSMSQTGQPPKPVEIDILVMHPGLNRSEATEWILFQSSDEQGFPVEYYLDVPSVICGDSQCDIITVRLFWDPLGNVVRYSFPEGGTLTKRGHKQFTDADHSKLLQILQDRESSMKNVAATDVVSPAEAQTGDEIDGASGATLLSDKSAIVPGAVYTCYNLWHWANSDIQETILSISEDKMTNEQLLQYLASERQERMAFAIEQLTERGAGDAATTQAVFELALQGNVELASRGLEYFESRGADTYYVAIEKLFAQSAEKQRVLYLSSLNATDLEAPAGFYDRLSTSLSSLESYYEVHLLLNLMNARNPSSAAVASNTLPLLESKSFLIGRKAYNFLMEEELAPEQTARLDAFQQKNADRL